MKKLLCMLLFLAGCSCCEVNAQTQPQPVRPVLASQQHNYRVESNYQQGNCNNCVKRRIVREPVEVVYKKTTYTTVYVPQTTAAVSYEKEPYCGQPLCK